MIRYSEVRRADSGFAENEKNGGREKANGKTEQKASAEAEELLETLREVPFPDPHVSAGTDRSIHFLLHSHVRYPDCLSGLQPRRRNVWTQQLGRIQIFQTVFTESLSVPTNPKYIIIGYLYIALELPGPDHFCHSDGSADQREVQKNRAVHFLPALLHFNGGNRRSGKRFLPRGRRD